MITLHGWHGWDAANPAAPAPSSALAPADLAVLWGLLRAEKLVEVFFHDGCVRDLAGFVRFATDPANWFYAAKGNGLFLGIGVVNNFSSGGTTAYAHLVSFKAGRERPQSAGARARDTLSTCPFAEAGLLWFELLRRKGGLTTLIAVIPACYRGVRQWAESFGFIARMLLPGALMLHRPGGETRRSDACVYQLDLNNDEPAPCNP